MVDFLDLPVEILPLILAYLPKPQHLANASLVNSTFKSFAIPRLYSRVSIYSWHKGGKVKVLNLFTTLATYPHLAKHVRRLEIRDFPKAIISSEEDILNLVVKGLQNCSNLHACTWTRDGTLSSDILGALCCSSSLQEIELNGHSQGQYDPQILSRFRNLTKISLIMPSGAVISQLTSMLRCSGEKLKHLTVICKTSPVVNDSVLETLAPLLVNLEQLYLTGCPKVTERGIISILNANKAGLTALGLEGVSPKFNMTAFAEHCIHSRALTNLQSITLTVSHFIDPQQWTQAVLTLLSASSDLTKFQIYATSSTAPRYPTAETLSSHMDSTTSLVGAIPRFLSNLVGVHGEKLERFSIHRIPLGIPSIRELCIRAPNLRELFVVVEPRFLNALPEALEHAKKLRTVHVNYPLEIGAQENDEDEEDGIQGEDPRPLLTPTQTLDLVRRCGPSLVQFGCNTRVWQVGRTIETRADGEKVAEMCLLPYEGQDIPEQFLVVRT
ncbi:hypothetical protein CC1G_04969 [Coprinopsis cinerea okayama7|uniref:F-box domain-containing protein n=1 Tax=Coprinopsis cinerea (strain Okayama-7 / 130 / ATCC MYA-4618 / FGSC 9003) TaxID=240176 RepID=A8NSC2_COPC7|nr:hypothetical protein CC1G_04969 [Coprinopsis cinerea okayama7\|eukprot:XP_001835976.2 hypothetical protein CC1G_04969 [Coprinopsis cinerea okayama7\